MSDTSKEALRLLNERMCAKVNDGGTIFAEDVADMLDAIRGLKAENDRLTDLVDRLRNSQSYVYIGKDGKPVQARDLEDECDRLKARVAELLELLFFAIEMTGEPDCYFDHHGYCQAHNLQPKGECWVELAKSALKNKDESDD